MREHERDTGGRGRHDGLLMDLLAGELSDFDKPGASAPASMGP
jgi:hypothetical protein